MSTLLNTTNEPDALAAGFHAPINPQDGGLRIEAETHRILGPIVTMWGADGQVEFVGRAAVNTVIRALQRAVALADRAGVVEVEGV